MNLLLGLIRLARPLNGLIAFISVILGAFIAGGSINLSVVVAAVVAFLLLSAGNALNDFCDVETDRINKPSRPIPSGRVKRQTALAFAVAAFVTGTSLSLLISQTAFSIACIVSMLLMLYTIRLRRLLLVGNILIGVLTGLTFIYGGIAVGAIAGAVIPGIFSFLFTTGREIIKDIQDVKGDRAVGLLSLPIGWGERKAMYVAFIFLVLVILVTPLPYIMGIYSLYYLLAVVFGVDLVLVYCMLILLTRFTERNVARVANIMKFDIFAGLGAIYLGTVLPVVS